MDRLIILLPECIQKYITEIRLMYNVHVNVHDHD